ncbi:hypothetical protein CVT25_003440 [Psilocybe cyanescens]|uniref:Pentacotripeptide-repeat region of PRORP domain-containing protein n=1 Tax=Psilocybe cyanescens TaxID=93625 RepID=A0A409WM11_PSICY|nr:hypothetical protein CVT25_003440 [Psilocybe cyanescens]
MLRASSLGLSYPLTTIFALHTCRRLYGARSRWVSRSRHASSSSGSGSSVLPEVAHHTSAFAHRQRQQQSQPHLPPQEEDVSPEENLHVAYAQQHRRLLQMGQVDEENTVLLAGSSASLTAPVEETQKGVKDGTAAVSSLDSEVSGTKEGANQTLDPQALDGDSPPSSSGKRREKIRKGPTRPERQVIQNPPSYTVGRPWSADPIARVDIPDKISHLLRNIENGLNKAHAQYERLIKERERKVRRDQRRRLANSVGRNFDGKSTPPPPASMKSNENITEVEYEAADFEKPPPLETTVHLREHLDVLGKTDSVNTAWASYTYLIDTISSHPIIYSRLKRIPYSHLHRFVRLLAHNRPRTHIQYLRLLSVMTYIVHVGGTLKQPEWNALIDHIGAGRRTTVAEDMERALAAFRSMSTGRLPGSSDFEMFETLPAQSSFEPDVYTMTILLSLAARAHDPATLKQISNAMVQTGIVPNRITHLSLLRYFTEKKDLSGVRRTLQKMRQSGLELGVDGLNACIWAYGNNGRLDVSLMIYRALRHNTFSEKDRALDDVHPTLAALQEEHIFVGDGMIPNEISYTALIQVMAYHGQFVPTIKIFIDMLSTENLEYGAPVEPSESGTPKPLPYAPTIAVFRAVFLGFSKHGISPSLVRDPDELDWTLKNLLEIFDRFLALPSNTTLTHSVLYIIITAFVQTSGGDMDVIRQAWLALDERFGIVFHKEHSQSRLVKMKQALFPDSLEVKNI